MLHSVDLILLAAFISTTGSLELKLSEIDTEWREADAPLFIGPLTPHAAPHAIAAYTLAQTRRQTAEKYVFNSLTTKVLTEPPHWLLLSLLFFGHLDGVFTRDAQRNGSSPAAKDRSTTRFLCLSLHFSCLFLQHRPRTSFGVPWTKL